MLIVLRILLFIVNVSFLSPLPFFLLSLKDLRFPPWEIYPMHCY